MRIAAVLGLSTALVVGCVGKENPHCGGRYHFHTSFPQEFRADVAAGVAGWNAFSDEQVIVDGESDETACSFRSIPWGGDEYQAIKSEEGKDFMGYSWGHDRSIVFAEGQYLRACVGNLGPDCIIGTTEHELGHAHGMGHVDGCAVMNPGEIKTAFTSADRAECVRAGACR